ncbi:hypothetical protein F2Q70_00000751 [Brassica cretica]|uniref:Uncharacterized protein n=1 Tax=Brassica cretica TaxID=69181 RepID=A0A8S9ILA3_BRACR|nr:hypothetical protein F2Q70_00000751 [Brassica cretica]
MKLNTSYSWSGFISSNWVVRYQGNLNCGTIYRLMNFFATKANTSIYRVVDHNLTIRFTHNPQSLNEHAVLDEVDGGWQHSAVKEFYSKFNESLAAPAALLVTTVNTKHIGDASTRTRGGITSPVVTAILRLTEGQLHLCFQKIWRLQRHWSCNYCVGAEISAYDYDEKGTFVLLGNAGPELIGRQAVMATWVLTMRCQLHNSRSSTLGAVNVCNTAIGGTCSTWSLAEPSASSKESVVQGKAKDETSLNQPQSRNPNHSCLIESLSISNCYLLYLFFLSSTFC